MANTGGQRTPKSVEEATDWVAACIAVTTEEVADWHFADQVIQYDWDRPLVKVLRFLVAPQSNTSSETFTENEEVVDLVEVLDLTTAEQLGEELAS